MTETERSKNSLILDRRTGASLGVEIAVTALWLTMFAVFLLVIR